MEKADTDLSLYILRFGAVIDPKKFAAITWQIISGIKAIHEKTLIHLDIKPENILVCGQYFKICDFGFVTESSKKPYRYKGTRTTVAPEVIMEHVYGKEADIWSLGVVFYFIRTGKYPFKIGSDKKDVLIDIVRKVKLDGIIKNQIKEFFKNRHVTYAAKTSIFDNKIIYYRHKNIISPF
uniref:Protein kinase domain-containing protein n=1 Tax=Panagrolaimus sp. ES5 TaxID=591445 RepID=A0AC34GP57_9BILA